MKKEVRDRYNKIAMEYALEFPLNSLAPVVIYRFADRVHGKVLDAGCGPGYTTHLLSNHGLKTFGLDISSEMIRLARRNFPVLDFTEGDIRSPPFPNNYFDGVFCYQTFPHIAPEEQAVSLQGLSRVLRPEGRLMIEIKNLYYPRSFLSSLISKLENPLIKLGEVETGGKSKTYRYFSTPARFVRRLERAGFYIEEVRGGLVSNWIQFWARKRK